MKIVSAFKKNGVVKVESNFPLNFPGQKPYKLPQIKGRLLTRFERLERTPLN